jgi:WD40 repeat protein
VFSHNSKVVASASRDKTVRTWNVETGKREQVIHLGHHTQVLSFMDGNAGLVTQAGVISFTNEPTAFIESATPSPSPAVLALGLQDDTSWVSLGGRHLLWLPAECRYGRTAIAGNTISIGCKSGRVIFLGFSASEIAKLQL